MYNLRSDGKVNYIRFFVVYLQRWQITNMPYMVKNIISSAFVFLLTCYAVKENAFEVMEATKSCLFAVLMCLIWSGLFNSIALFFSESDYMMDDLSKVLPVRVYIIANGFVQAFLCMVEAIVSVTIFSLMFDYASEGIVMPTMNLDYGITFFMILFSADMLGFAVGVLVKNITTAMTVIPLVLIAQFLFSGCLFDLSGALKMVSQYTSAKWGFSALGSLADLNNITSNFANACRKYGIPYSQKVNELFDASRSFVLECWMHLFILTIIASALASILLYLKLNKSEDSILSKML